MGEQEKTVIKKILWIYFCWMVVILSVGIFASNLSFYQNNVQRFAPDYPYARWDSGWYISIAKNGYFFDSIKNSSVAFFPLFPLLMKAVFFLTGLQEAWSGALINIILTPFLLVTLFKLLRIDFSESVSFRTVIYLLLFPTAFFFIGVFSDTLFLLLAVLSIYEARNRHWLSSGLLAFLGTLTRPMGVTLLFILAIEYLSVKRYDLMNSIKSLDWLPILLPIPALGSHLIFMWIKFGMPFAPFIAEKTWGRKLSNPIHTVLGYLYRIISEPIFTNENFHFLLNFSVLIIFTVLISFLYKKVRVSYIIFSLFIFLPPILTGTLSGINRYVLAIFPAFIILGLREEKWFKNIFPYFSFAIQLVLAFLFVRWFNLD